VRGCGPVLVSRYRKLAKRHRQRLNGFADDMSERNSFQ
jgi:hypothetical protein